MISYDFRYVILSRAGCSALVRCQHLASRSGNTAGNNPAEVGWWNYFILFCDPCHNRKIYWIAGVSLWAKRRESCRDTVTTPGQELLTWWSNKTFVFPYGNQVMLGNFHLSCHKRLNSQNSILFLFKGRDATGINRSSTGMKELKCQVCICRNWFCWRLCRYNYAALFPIALLLYYLRQSAHRGHRCTLLDVEWVLLKISSLKPTTYLLLCNLINCDTM